MKRPPPVPPEPAGSEEFKSRRSLTTLQAQVEWLIEEVQRIAAIVDAASKHYDAIVLSAVTPYLVKLQKLDGIEAELAAAKAERERRAAHDEAARALREGEAHTVTVAKTAAETRKLVVDTEYVPIDSHRRVRTALFTALAVILAALVSATVTSWLRRPV